MSNSLLSVLRENVNEYQNARVIQRCADSPNVCGPEPKSKDVVDNPKSLSEIISEMMNLGAVSF